MYIGLAITSDEYTNLYWEAGSDMEQIQKALVNIVASPGATEEWETIEKTFTNIAASHGKIAECVSTTRGIRGTIRSTEDDWAVIEIYEIDDNPWALVEWHAYDGVDFTVKTYPTQEEASKVMRYDAANAATQFSSAIECWDPCFINLDTGNEWLMYQIVQIKEGFWKSCELAHPKTDTKQPVSCMELERR